MNRLSIFLISTLFCVLVSCGNREKSVESVKAIEQTDSCDVDSKNTYEIYLPERSSADEKLPLLIIIDAHGGGKFALDKFKDAANDYPVILVASNSIKNGFRNFKGAIQILIEDVQQKYPVSETVIISGFSGGARMALGYASTHQVDGLILCGALADAEQIKATRCPVFSISGTDDFNFIETAQYLFQNQLIPENLAFELIDASHNWPDSQTLTNALGYIYLQDKTDSSPIATKRFELFCENQQMRIDSLKEEDDFLKATIIARNMATTSPFNSDKVFNSSYNDLKIHPEYSSQLKRLEDCLILEIDKRNPYINALMMEDSIWWKKELGEIAQKIEKEKDPYRRDMYRRIKAFLGIACYSLSNQSVREKNEIQLNKIIPLYRIIEPKNPDVLFFSAIASYWKGNISTTLSLLKQAKESGFSDLSKIKDTFPPSITSKIN